MSEKIRKLKLRGDNRGSLIALEANRDIPFDIKRVYYIFGTKKGVVRGLHAHKKLKQILICISGSCTIVLDDGKARDEVMLEDASVGLEIDPCVWHEMKDFSSDAVLLVLASDYYSEDDYLRDYNDFLHFLKNENGQV